MRSRAGAAALVVLVSVAAAGCGSASGTGSASGAGAATTTGAGAQAAGQVRLLYAGSLVDLVEHHLGPAFHQATGATLDGLPGGSVALAHEIDDGVHRADVFLSAAPSVNSLLEGAAHGNRLRWYATFAAAGLVLAYEPSSRFAAALRSRPWYDVVTEPGFRLGRTDPALDPKGRLTVAALHSAAARFHDPALLAALSRSEVFPEEELLGRLESGQLDAGFFYANEAVEQRLPMVALGVPEEARYTVSVLTDAPNPRGGAAFVAFLLGARGRALLAADGLTVLTPKVSGDPAAVPAALRAVLGLAGAGGG